MLQPHVLHGKLLRVIRDISATQAGAGVRAKDAVDASLMQLKPCLEAVGINDTQLDAAHLHVVLHLLEKGSASG